MPIMLATKRPSTWWGLFSASAGWDAKAFVSFWHPVVTVLPDGVRLALGAVLPGPSAGRRCRRQAFYRAATIDAGRSQSALLSHQLFGSSAIGAAVAKRR